LDGLTSSWWLGIQFVYTRGIEGKVDFVG